ncbi:RNA polymerase sigma factor [Paraliomyxa miuraensis]|uniref:RNA polymerase sigma factor n=1 Tax=Paraliomyxa miuraensis TaxID=376150 RepID=UPI0022565D16|nr:sigma-70 family RNA polymerase sigma factor [Paraliomyxa miuraensis]MCX4247615.1 sigma-70 family RNA polymerase sigma factor [Paraliomyxa miuraensis]
MALHPHAASRSTPRSLRVIEGDDPQRAFEDAYAAHHAAVWRCLRALGVPDAMIDDATQDVFLVVYRRLPHFDHAAPIRSWILGIARNVALKVHERRRRAPPRLALVPSEPVEPEEVLARRDAAALVERFLDRLEPPQREVFVLAQLEGLAVPEIARMLGIKLDTAYSRLRLARRRFERVVARHFAMGDRRTR